MSIGTRTSAFRILNRRLQGEMLRINLRLLLVTVLLFVGANLAFGQESAAALDRKIKAQVRDIGAGTKITVIMKDGTKLTGRITQILADSFDITIKNETHSNVISYRDVQKIKKRTRF